MILSQTQAEATYRAMCELNNVGAKIRASMPDRTDPSRLIFVEECEETGQITVTVGLRRMGWHENQNTFAAAYGLLQG